jgi:Secretion system C-terminal sorting domain
MRACTKLLLMFFLGFSFSLGTIQAQVWEALDGGIPATPTAITTSGNLMAVAYSLGFEKEHRFHEISIWNGVYWSKLPRISSDSNSLIMALQFKDSGLYIGGRFHQFNGLSNVHNLIYWKNRKYSAITALSGASSGNGYYIKHLSIWGKKLVVAGNFKNEVVSGGNHLAFLEEGKWVSSGVSSLSNINGPVNTFAVVKGRIVVGGHFTKIGSKETFYLGSYAKTQAYERVKNDFIPQKVAIVDTGVIYWGLHATDKSKMPSFFYYTSDTIHEVNTGLDKINDIYDIVSDGNNVFAVGAFKLDGSDVIHHLIKFDDGLWKGVPGGVFPGLKKITLMRGSLVVGGIFKSHRNISLVRIARFIPNKGAVTGRIYFDKDGNCVFNARDESLNNRLIHITPGDFYIRPNEKGTYLVYLKEGKYTFTVIPHKYWTASACDVLSKKVIVEDGEVTDTTNFALVQNTSVRDLSVKLSSQTGSLATRKNIQQYYINYENLGSNEVDDAIITLHIDSKLEKMQSSPEPTSVAGDSATWDLSLIPGMANMIKCQFKISSEAEDELNMLATITQKQQVEENDNENNTSSLTQIIQESDIEISKQVFPGYVAGDTAYIEEGTGTVDYQISFSNYSSDTVRTVYVIDTIGLNHSMKEIRETGASHPYSYQIIPGQPGQNVATIIWTFNNINLAPNPSKYGEIVNDDGFIGFSIGLKDNLEGGVVLSNTAQVAFDYSEKKVSNSVFAIVMKPSGIWDIKTVGEIKVYPNPSIDFITVKNTQLFDNEYEIYSLNGSLIQAGKYDSQNIITTKNLIKGMYILQLGNQDKRYRTRLIKQ